MAVKNIRAVAVVLKKGINESQIRVPAEVKHCLGVRVGDQVIFERGCDRAVTDAAIRGIYFVVRAERTPQPVSTETVQADEPTSLESLAETVRKRLKESK